MDICDDIRLFQVCGNKALLQRYSDDFVNNSYFKRCYYVEICKKKNLRRSKRKKSNPPPLHSF